VYVERYGTGARAFLGLHGWGSDRGVFEPLAAHVPEDASFFSADLPGVGKSPPPIEWKVDHILADIIGTICILNVESLTVVGHCGGAVFGLLAARWNASTSLRGKVPSKRPFWISSAAGRARAMKLIGSSRRKRASSAFGAREHRLRQTVETRPEPDWSAAARRRWSTPTSAPPVSAPKLKPV